ncbi:DUF3105 domain-containing protein [Williamsia sp. CHRR-6]|uniref:DUF3105 domain-containing protein n=1 Tax=Williamsia sp. CHRR-6 TaxID=2835871 RepID=UPI001BDB4BDF|nr:DUF3105 domain-containing protein [Williamsia sp. CHRR-6]MBT0568437.1 DUF3105 domain-containing protein [Williamsia sp. CHRR-6]
MATEDSTDDSRDTTSGRGSTPKKPAPKRKPAKPGTVPVVKAAGGRPIPWLTIAAVVVVLAIVGGLTAYLVPKYNEQQAEQKYVPSSSNPDPASKIAGVTKVFYPAGQHVAATQRVAYDKNPPFGGPHDQVWAACTGIVYPKPLRTENAVHSMEHGAVWIAYNPTTAPAADVETLKKKVQGQQYMLMSPYPDLDTPISLQAWGHQLKLTSASDPRVDQFIKATRLNSQAGVYPGRPKDTSYPEIGASCAAYPGAFDPANPPPADVGPLPADAIKMDGTGAQKATDETPGAAAPTPAG